MDAAPFCHVDFASTDLEVSERFYTTVFGWEFLPGSDPVYRLFKTSSNIGGGIWKSETIMPQGGVVVYLFVSDIEARLAAVEANGGKTVVGKSPIPEHGWYAQFTDPFGNKLGLFTPLEHK